MDQLMSDFTPPRVSTSFEKKVGASLCKASELAMSDKLPKFRLVSAPTGGSKTTSSIALLAMLANEDKGFTGAYICKTIEECEYVYRRLKRLVDPSVLAVYSYLHSYEATPVMLMEKKKEHGLEIHDHFDSMDLHKSRLIITTHSRWKKEYEDEKDFGVRKYKGNQRDLIIIDEEPELFSIFPCLPYEVGELVDRLSGLMHQEEVQPKDTKVIHKFTTALRSIQQRMERITDGSIREATYIPVDLVEDHENEDVLEVTHVDLGKYLDQMSLSKRSDQYDRLMNTLSFLHAVAEGMGFHTRQGTSGFYAYKCVMSAEAGSVVLDGSADLNGVYGLCKGMELVDVPEVDYRNIKVTHITPPNEFKNKMRPYCIMKNSWSAKPYIEKLAEASSLPVREVVK